jgi:hypothetical protein
MKNLFKILLAVLFLPLIAFGQGQGNDLSLGAGGTVIIGRVNEADANLASADGKANYLALTKSGRIMVAGGALGANADVTATGNLDMTSTLSTVVANLSGYDSMAAFVNGGTGGGFIFEGSMDNTTWTSLYCNPYSTSGFPLGNPSSTQSNVANLFTKCETFGLKYGRVRVSSTGTGTAAVTIVAKTSPNYIYVHGVTPGTASNQLAKAQDLAVGATDVGIGTLLKRTDSPATVTPAVNDYVFGVVNDFGAQYIDGVRRSAFVHTQPTVTNITSFTCASANAARRSLTIQNNSAANIMINLNNGTLTGIVPTSTNLGIVLTAGSSYSTPPNAAPTAAVTCYQSSGGSINTISVIEQS